VAAVKADLVLRRGRVFCGLADGFAESIAVRAERVVAVGGDRDLAGLVGPGTTVIDLRGRAVVPGFNDAHQHQLPLGLALQEIDLRGDRVRSLDELLRRVEERAAATPPGAWVIGGRYDHFQLDVKRHPHRDELDRAAPAHPVYIRRTDGHMGVANSLALAAARIDETTPDPPGGHIERHDGRLTGLVQERAQDLVLRALPPLALEALVEAIETAGRLLVSQGITSVMDAGVGLRQGWDDYLAYREASKQGRLLVRTSMAITGGPQGVQDRAQAEGLVTGSGDDHLRVGPVKLFADGSAGGRTAAMSAPYLPGPDGTTTRGIVIFPERELNALVRHYHELGHQVAIHAIGDAAIEQALGAVELALSATPAGDRRHRIEHCGFPTPAQTARMGRLGMTLAGQPIFVYEFGDLYVDVLGDERPQHAYPMRSWLDAGLHPAASSDAPVSESNPMPNLYAMVTRRTARGRVLGAGEAVTLAEAVHAYTYCGAWGSRSEASKGRLVEGQLADLAVVDRDIFATPPDELLRARVDLTVIGGRVAWDRSSEVAS
jgi:predicted amidohydrolase YtcJ